nr:hypothetical protein Iba_chr12bCG4730 [Ipomoea batatas]
MDRGLLEERNGVTSVNLAAKLSKNRSEMEVERSREQEDCSIRKTRSASFLGSVTIPLTYVVDLWVPLRHVLPPVLQQQPLEEQQPQPLL